MLTYFFANTLKHPKNLIFCLVAMVHSHINIILHEHTCIIAVHCANTTSINRLRIKQKQAVKIICNAGFRDHTALLFAHLRILSLDQLVKLSALKFMHSFSHNLLPWSFRETWITNSENKIPIENFVMPMIYIPAHNYTTLKK
jgi:hypothetical protein